ncbi:MAG: cyclodeaminase/cyclohydrolase family protein [Defluviitaleaceae bacterium]|nr:cyclodeaminase/cyclohydrolase family protein [Defluviitaleaceae bacterium]MCL2273933.1 cyclodeaminase/cyclohydrolase family protein [Defluviitaleaceae bacterium]
MLTNLNLKDFVNQVASNSPAPGGGSVAAVTAAQGIGLTRMVALLTIGKKKYAEHDALMHDIAEKAQILTAQLTDYIDKDTDAYNGVSAVFSMPKETDAEKSARSIAMQAALKTAAIIPFEVMQKCVEALKLTEQAIGKSNTNAASDLGVAALNLGTGAMSAWLNVKINLAGIKDENFVREYTQKGKALDTQAQEISAKIYESVLEVI